MTDHAPEQHVPAHTPWGAIQSRDTLLPGVVFVSTAGHGGVHLSPERAAALRRAFPGFQPFAGWPWFEEDEDVTAVFLAFSTEFPDDRVWRAVRSVRARAQREGTSRWTIVHRWLEETADGQAAAARADAWQAANADRWETGGMGTCGGLWLVFFYQLVGDGRRKVSMPYPDQKFYTTAELDALAAAHPQHAAAGGA